MVRLEEASTPELERELDRRRVDKVLMKTKHAAKEALTMGSGLKFVVKYHVDGREHTFCCLESAEDLRTLRAICRYVEDNIQASAIQQTIKDMESEEALHSTHTD